MSTLILGHRGAMGYAPENTLLSFTLAAQQQAQGVELDVFLTKDKKIVITHDENTKRLTGKKLTVRQSPLAELKTLDFGRGEQIPTLEEFLEKFSKIFSVINIEIKSTGLTNDGIEDAVANCIRDFHLEEKVVLSSFNFFNLLRLKKKYPSLKRGYLISPHTWTNRWIFLIKKIEPWSVNLGTQFSPRDIPFFRKLAPQVWVWTVNEEKEMESWIQSGIDGLITNFPDRALQIQKNYET